MSVRIYLVSIDCSDPGSLAGFWEKALGWRVAFQSEDEVAIEPPESDAPALLFIKVPEPKSVKNRVHLDLAPFAIDDQLTEVERLVSLGARRIDIGQGDVPWVVMADPEGNEFCVLTPR